jgi:hypothetical protein
MPWQQSWSRTQTSPNALQFAAGLQTPPWQLVEQQSPGAVHASPRVLQVWPVGPAGIGWHAPPVQMLEQHWLASVQLCEIWRHAVDEQVPALRQFCKQHSESVPHRSPA